MKGYLKTNNFFDDAFDSLFTPRFSGASSVMKTDIKEREKEYELSIELAGFKKENVTINFEKGYLTVSGKNEEKEEGSKFLRRERTVSCSRSYYVGDIDKSTVKAKFENGVLFITIPKEQEKVHESSFIEIE